MTEPTRRTLSRLAVPWGAALAMTVLIAAMAARGPASSRAAQQATTAPPPAVDETRAIVRVVGREITVTISAGERGNVFSARRADGTVLADNVTLDQLRTTQPSAYRQVQPALADAWAAVE